MDRHKLTIQQRMGPPLSTDEIDEFDDSEAFLVDVDASKLKQFPDGDVRFDFIMDFYLTVRFKRNLPLFDHPGQIDIEGGVVSESSPEKYNEIAQFAIAEYNNRTKKGKLELSNVEKVNRSYFDYYITFSARNVDTGHPSVYQAMLKLYGIDRYVLGLLKERDSDKPLVILSVTGGGSEEILESERQHYRKYQGATCYGLRDDASEESSEQTKDRARKVSSELTEDRASKGSSEQTEDRASEESSGLTEDFEDARKRIKLTPPS